MTRIGSMFTGYGGLDAAVAAVLDADVVWHCETDAGAAAVLEHRFPGVPNLGDVTAVEWTELEPVDVLCGGFPCQDVSAAGKRAGLVPDSRSGLWTHMARAIGVLRPPLVVIENVRGLLSAKAKAAGDVGPDDGVLVDSADRPLRALGAVLGDLADLGYDARWCCVNACDVGAPHRRARVFVVAYPRRSGVQRWAVDRGVAGAEAPRAGEGLQRQRRGDTVGDDGPAVADADDAGRGEHGGPVAAPPEHAAAERGRDADADPDSTERRRAVPVAVGGVGAEPNGLGPQEPRRRDRLAPDADEQDAARAGVDGPRGWAEPTDGGGPVADADGGGFPELSELDTEQWVGNNGTQPHGDDAVGLGVVDSSRWGKYAEAVARWEYVTGQPAPEPTQLGKRGGTQLAPPFVEWMMGLRAGWITEVPGLSRNQQLKILGNGVCPQQAIAAVRQLLESD